MFLSVFVKKLILTILNVKYQDVLLTHFELQLLPVDIRILLRRVNVIKLCSPRVNKHPRIIIIIIIIIANVVIIICTKCHTSLQLSEFASSTLYALRVDKQPA